MPSAQNPLTLFYNQFIGDVLPGTPLEEQEIQFIAYCIGFPRNQQDFNWRITETQNYEMEVIRLRQIVIEILRLEQLREDSISKNQVSKVEDITLNMNYTDKILDELSSNVKMLARMLKLPVLDNLYVSSDDVTGRLNDLGQLLPMSRGGSHDSYLTARTVR
jgi:hypothetical protein